MAKWGVDRTMHIFSRVGWGINERESAETLNRNPELEFTTMDLLFRRVKDVLIRATPLWIWVCVLYTIAGVLIGLTAYIGGLVFQRAVDPILVLIGGIAGLIAGALTLLRMR